MASRNSYNNEKWADEYLMDNKDILIFLESAIRMWEKEKDEIDFYNDLAAQAARREAAIYRAIEYGEETKEVERWD